MTPEGWRSTTLGRLADGEKGIQTGPFGSQLHASEYADSGIPVIMPKDLVDGTVDTGGVARIPAAKAACLERFRVRPGDVLFARRGELGRCALMTGAEAGWICGTGCLRVRLRALIEPRFLIQYLCWRRAVAWLEENAVGQTMPSINTEILSRAPVLLAPLPEQRRIASVLESVDETVRSARAVVEQSRKLCDSLLRELLRSGVAAGASRSLVPSPQGEIPEDWEVRTLGELATFTNGVHIKAADWSDKGVPVVRIQNLNGSRDFKLFAGYAKAQWFVEAGELLFAWAGAKGVSFGPCIWPGPRGVLNQHIYRVRPRQGVSKAWLYELLCQTTRRIEDKAHGFKSSLVHVRKADVTGLAVPVPPYQEQRAIATRAAELAARVALERAALERALALKRGLMRDLFTGRVRCGAVE